MFKRSKNMSRMTSCTQDEVSGTICTRFTQTNPCFQRRYSEAVNDRADCHHIIYTAIHQTYEVC